MIVFRPLILFSTLCLVTANLFSACGGGGCCSGGGGGANGGCGRGKAQVDYPVVMDYVNSKRSIPLKDKGPSLSNSGDVRAGWGHIEEKIMGFDLRKPGAIPTDKQLEALCKCGDKDPCTCIDSETGKCSKCCFPKDVFEIEYNLYVDYACDRSWAVAWIEFANTAGIDSNRPCNKDKDACRGSGCCENLCLRKAYLGYNVIADGCFRFDIELGRRPLWSVFNSYIQFRERFDGALFRFAYNVCDVSDIYLNCGPFTVDERSHHFAFVGETGYLNIANCSIDLLYSFITWSKHGPNRCGVSNALGNRFDNSQLTVNYWLNPEYTCYKVKLFAAGLINSAAAPLSKLFKDLEQDDTDVNLSSKQNLAWYAGALIGQVCEAGDWSLDVSYQYVQAQAIPGRDISGIGRGNVLQESFILATDPKDARGCGNYKGWRFEALYAISDNLSLDALFQFSTPIDKNLGGDHDYSLFRLQAIYAF